MKTKFLQRQILLVLLAFVSLHALAKITVEASIDSIQIFVGQQAHVTLKVTSSFKDKLELPPFKPNSMVLPNVELLDVSNPDTTEFDGNRVVSQVYTFTSFDSALYYLPPLPVKVNGKEYKSESLALKVLTIDVDTTKLDQFFPPKDVADNEFSWNDWTPVLIMALIIIAIVVLFYFLYGRFKSNKPILTRIRIVKKLLPHQKALMALEDLKATAPQLEEEVGEEAPKEYYTRLTDALRKYIEERFGFNAMEMTSTEIIQRLRDNNDEESLTELRHLFQTADLVKFAKYSTQLNENDMNLVNAIEFINSTKIENAPTEEEVKPQISERDKKSMTERRVLKVVLTIMVLLGIAVVAYLAYTLYDLLF